MGDGSTRARGSATCTACTTPEVRSCRCITSSSQDIAFLSMFGLTQRMKCVFVALSVLTSSLSETRNESITPKRGHSIKLFIE